MKRIAVIGGGISGLSAAFTLEKHRRKGIPLEYVLLESSNRFGGVIQTERLDGCVLEAGPDSFLTEKPWAADLCRELGLGDQLIGSNDAERKTYLLVKKRLVSIPDGLMFMVPTRLVPTFFSPLFSWRTKLRILREWFYRRGENHEESTVANFVQRHYGREMVERVADPLLAGVYGGSADELSVLSVLPRFLEMEQKYGSLGKGMVAMRKRRGASAGAPLFTSLKQGIQQMVDALLAQIPEPMRRTDARIQSVSREAGHWQVVSNGGSEEFDAVIVATPAYVTADLLHSETELTKELSAIPYSSSMTVILGYEADIRASLPLGFGFLVPRTGNLHILAATFVHNKFPHRAPADRALIRCFLGGNREEEILRRSDDEIQSVVLRELAQVLGLQAAPLLVRISRWRKAMAQYPVGHSSRIARIRNLLAQASGLALAGNAYSGIGVPDCIRSGSEAAAKVLTDLGLAPSA
jgi:oxygen-dependent protoporphyrinogen oxidase